MKIGIASDHAGFAHKQALKAHLESLGHSVVDFGCHSEARTDYPQWIRPCAEAVANGDVDRGIVLGGSGNGEAIVANRVPHVRCAYCFNDESARLGRAHNDANCIAIGQRLVDLPTAKRIVDIFLTEPFEGGRHEARIRAIDCLGEREA
ncbi:MAG: ribose 5-phosphate isomerase B [Phycisphaeraceae bacterium]